MTTTEKQIKMYLKNEGLTYPVKTIRWIIYVIELGKENSLALNIRLVEGVKGLL
jgi:hypothetical protein